MRKELRQLLPVIAVVFLGGSVVGYLYGAYDWSEDARLAATTLAIAVALIVFELSHPAGRWGRSKNGA